MDDDHTVYSVVASRRLQWDNLLWQVPVLGLTAQAFLFTTALGSGDRWSKVIASVLGGVMKVTGVT